LGGKKQYNECWSVILSTLFISFFKGTVTFAIFTLSGKAPDLKETLKIWTNVFLYIIYTV